MESGSTGSAPHAPTVYVDPDSPLHAALLELLGDHEEGVGLAVGGGVGAEVVYVQSLHHPGLGPLVVHVQLHPVRHVVAHRALPQLNRTPAAQLGI